MEFTDLNRTISSSSQCSLHNWSVSIITLSHSSTVIWWFWNAEERRWMISFMLWVLSRNFVLGACQMHHIWLNLCITAGVLGTPNKAMIFWWVVVTIKHHSNALSVPAKILYIRSSDNCQQSPAKYGLIPTSPCRAPSTNRLEQGWSVSEWVSQHLRASLLLNKDKGRGVSSCHKLTSSVISCWATITVSVE